jgi:transcriptional regulator with XRE-family HTH domain
MYQNGLIGVKMTKLAEFVLDYIKRNNISRRALAEKMEVQHRTLNNYLNTDKSPTLYFLIQLSHATGYDLLTLVAMVAPDNVHHATADDMLLAQDIHKLPEARRAIIIELVRGGAGKGGDTGSNEGKIGVVKK